MAGISSTSDQTTTTISLPSVPKITNLAMGLANTEETHVLVTNLKKLSFKSRNDGILKYSYTVGESGTKFITVPRRVEEVEENIDFPSGTLAVQSSQASDIIEIKEWS